MKNFDRKKCFSDWLKQAKKPGKKDGLWFDFGTQTYFAVYMQKQIKKEAA